MSFGRLGIAHSPVLHRQFSSPTSSRYQESSSDQDNLTQDNKDVLVERLNDLVQRLSEEGSAVDDKAVTNIHHLVDGIETLMREKPKALPVDESDNESESEDTTGPERLLSPPLPRNPIQHMRMRLPDIWTTPQPPVPPQQEVNVSKTVEIAKEAEELALQLTKTLGELQIRKEESDVSLDSISHWELCTFF